MEVEEENLEKLERLAFWDNVFLCFVDVSIHKKLQETPAQGPRNKQSKAKHENSVQSCSPWTVYTIYIYLYHSLIH